MDNKSKWIAALRSGNFSQGFGTAFRNGRYCALGVYSKVVGDDKEIAYKIRHNVTRRNDFFRQTFSEIADYLEALPERF